MATTIVLGAFVGMGCAQSRPRVSESAPPVAPLAEPPPDSQPGILLTMLRSERDDPGPRETVVPMTRRAQRRNLSTDDSTEDSTEDSTDGEVRNIVVKTTRLATPEAMVRAAIRDAPSRRPRVLSEYRLLVRVRPSLPVVGSKADRAVARGHLRARRAEIKSCLLGALARQPGIAFQTPSALVVEQALRRGPLQFEFDAHYDAPGRTPRIVDRSAALDPQTRSCLADAMAGAAADGEVVVPVSAFGQAAVGFGESGFHKGLARSAAATGWAHYQRGEYHEALAFFEDAFWAYHRLEYKVLIGLALEKLERPVEAAAAFDAYAHGRKHAPDAAGLRVRAEQLRGTGPSGFRPVDRVQARLGHGGRVVVPIG